MAIRDFADRMLAMIDRSSWSADGGGRVFQIAVGDAVIDFDAIAPSVGLAFERLGAAVEAAIAAERARQMMEAAGLASHPLPLWLVSGSDIVAQWLRWAGTSNALRKVLTLTDQVDAAPVVGFLDRRARRELGQGGAKIRVRGGMAIAERIELSDPPRCIATIGEHARIRIDKFKLPETLIVSLQPDPSSNTLRPLDEVVSHPFFAAADLRITGVASEGSALMVEVESHWTPLEPVPDAVRAVLPADADPVFPWRATRGERHLLDGLVDEARRRVAVTGDPR